MCVLSYEVWILYTRVFYHMIFEWECVGDFMYAFYYLSDFICIHLHMYWVKLDLIKLLKPENYRPINGIYTLAEIITQLPLLKKHLCNAYWGLFSSQLQNEFFGKVGFIFIFAGVSWIPWANGLKNGTNRSIYHRDLDHNFISHSLFDIDVLCSNCSIQYVLIPT